jgi:hypothetical protein
MTSFGRSSAAGASRRAGLHTSYTGGRDSGFKLAWYSYGQSKITGEPCFKLEARIRWADHLRRFGIRSNASLPDLSIREFLPGLYILAVPDSVLVAHEHLRRHPQQPLPPPIRLPSGFVYDPLCRLGSLVIRRLSYYPEDPHPFRSSQCFVTAFHSSACLRPI